MIFLISLLFGIVSADCFDDAQCRSNIFCNGLCNKTSGKCIDNIVPVSCSVNTVCYKTKGFCVEKCVIDSDCKEEKGVCDRKTGKCNVCLYDIDCDPFYPETCGSKCFYNNLTFLNECSKGKKCFLGQNCYLNDYFNKSLFFRCSLSHMLHVMFPFLLIFSLVCASHVV